MTDSAWTLGLAGWVIQDGDFVDVEKGQELSFRIEISPAPAWTAATGFDTTLASSPLDGSAREFVGELVFVNEEFWVMDVGTLVCGVGELPLVYAGRETPDVRVGDRFVRDGSFLVLAVAIDVNFEGAPAHRYQWRIDRIELETTPWIEVEPRSWKRDPGNVSHREVDRTDAWRDDPYMPEYLLHCSLLSGPVA